MKNYRVTQVVNEYGVTRYSSDTTDRSKSTLFWLLGFFNSLYLFLCVDLQFWP